MILVPPSVAAAIRHYTDLADTKSEAFTDILTMGFEGARSEVILRHFDGNHDELMEALIYGYEVAQTPEDKIRDYFESHKEAGESVGEFAREYHDGVCDSIRHTLTLLGIKIDGVNA